LDLSTQPFDTLRAVSGSAELTVEAIVEPSSVLFADSVLTLLTADS
jgi:hypothetical protein